MSEISDREAQLRRRCKAGDTFTAEEVRWLLDAIATLRAEAMTRVFSRLDSALGRVPPMLPRSALPAWLRQQLRGAT